MAGKIDGFKIPGLVEGKKDQNMAKLNEAEIQAVRDQYQDHHQTSPALIDPNISNISNIWGQSPPPPPFYQPYDNKWDSLKKTRIPQRPIGPFDDSSKRDFDDSLEQFKKYIYKDKDKKSAFEELIDELFSTAEKEQFLIDVGYEFESPKDVLSTFPMDPIIRRKMTDGTYKIIKESVDSLFLKEITVKFKNLLLAKSILKLKLNVQDQIKAQENSSSGE